MGLTWPLGEIVTTSSFAAVSSCKSGSSAGTNSLSFLSRHTSSHDRQTNRFCGPRSPSVQAVPPPPSNRKFESKSHSPVDTAIIEHRQLLRGSAVASQRTCTSHIQITSPKPVSPQPALASLQPFNNCAQHRKVVLGRSTYHVRIPSC
jgi:hypothetical protein